MRQTPIHTAHKNWARLRYMPLGTLIRVRIRTLEPEPKYLLLWRHENGSWREIPPRHAIFKDDAIFVIDNHPPIVGHYYSWKEEF